MRRAFEKVECPGCGRRISAYVPHMGNGADVKLVAHNHPRGIECPASDRLIGEYKAAREQFESSR